MRTVKAEIRWLIDDATLGIESSTIEAVEIDGNYVAAEQDAVIDWIESKLEEKYGVSFIAADDSFVGEDEDFVVLNMADVIDELLEGHSL